MMQVPFALKRQKSPIKTKAIVFEEGGGVRRSDVALPPCGPTQVRVRTLFSFVSPGTELRMLGGHYGAEGRFPFVPGYASIGRVEEVGAEAKGFRVGDLISCRNSVSFANCTVLYGGHAGARLFVNFQRRYGRPFELAKEAVESGRLGAIASVDLAQPCSNALDFGPHFVNAALFILGNPVPKAVFAGAEGLGTVPWHGMKVEARLAAAVYLENGIRLDYTAMPENSWYAPVIRVNGTKGFCELWTNKPEEAKSVFRLVTAEGEENPALDENFHHGDEDRFLYFQRCYADIARAIRTGTPSRVDFEGGYATQKILLAMYESAEKGRLVEAL